MNILPHEELNQSDDGRTLTKTHQWKQHLWANCPFLNTPRINKILSTIFNKKNVDAFVESVRQKYPEFWHPKHWDLLVERIATLQMVFEKGMTLSELGEFYSSKAPKSQKHKDGIDFYVSKFLSGDTHLELAANTNAPHESAEAYAKIYDDGYDIKENDIFHLHDSAPYEYDAKANEFLVSLGSEED